MWLCQLSLIREVIIVEPLCVGGAHNKPRQWQHHKQHMKYSEFSRLLGKFPDLTRPTSSTADTKHGVEHHVPTTGPLFHIIYPLSQTQSSEEVGFEMETLGIAVPLFLLTPTPEVSLGSLPFSRALALLSTALEPRDRKKAVNFSFFKE
ncbi:hypothetical protein AAFF_G00203970 [Aldrovandia affinis]|uniref:Uncharacterized protein n=1 Tax=Aldrovandia affinis TaxID=143900 RepID=A0AAD7SXA8_9TELE|nr:hypothetical protein AAFF_G00203970 [Aldrovandia affinis]